VSPGGSPNDVAAAAGQVSVRDALHAAMVDEMSADPSVLLMGEDIGIAGGVFQVTRGLQEQFGPARVIDTAISEMALAGAGFGAAVTGSRPVVEIMFADFLLLAMDSLVNQAAKYAFVSAGQGHVPLVIRCAVGGGARMGAMHSQIPASWLMGVPGLKIVAPSDPASAYGLLRGAIRDDDPVVVMEHKMLYSVKGPTWDLEPIPPGRARIARAGSDLTIITAMRTVLDALEAADRLSSMHGIEATVIDLRSLRPLDVETIATSVSATGRALVVEEGPRTGGWAGEVVTTITEACWGQLDELWRLTSPDMPVPFSPPLEEAYLPRADAIVRSVLEHG
jgi:acetoin:2,6-dichlorophenolindophenol oxidoreductase subunit beta